MKLCLFFPAVTEVQVIKKFKGKHLAATDEIPHYVANICVEAIK
jgi:hypothetical protein